MAVTVTSAVVGVAVTVRRAVVGGSVRGCYSEACSGGSQWVSGCASEAC